MHKCNSPMKNLSSEPPMNAATAAPEGRMRAPTTYTRSVPLDITREILQNLRIKTLLRFSTVSKSWNSMIFDPSFIQKHKSRAAMHGRQMLVTIPSSTDYLFGASVCRISLASSEHRIAVEDSTDLVCPLEGVPYLLAFCDELWLVQVGKSIYLWNHPMRMCRKLPDPLLPPPIVVPDYELGGDVYGLAYDSAGDDYKVLKLTRQGFPSIETEAELYSVKSNSWKNIQFPSQRSWINHKKCECVNGAFHWICDVGTEIISFNPSSEEHGEIPLPKSSPINSFGGEAKVVVLRGMLCVTAVSGLVVIRRGRRYVVWGMQEYGVEKSWSKIIKINGKDIDILRPLCLYDNGDILLKLKGSGIFIYRDNGGGLKKQEKIVGRDGDDEIRDGFIYVETLALLAVRLH